MIFNQGNTTAADRKGIPAVTLTANNTSGIPVIGTTYALGVDAGRHAGAADAGLRQHAAPDAADLQRAGREDRRQRQQRRHGRRAPRLRARGTGHQRQRLGRRRNARERGQIANLKPKNTLRFAWWGAEESGLVGSTDYVNGLSQAEKDRIALYLNFDMIGSPNYIRWCTTATSRASTAPVPVPEGSIAIEDLFESFYTLSGEPYDDAEFSGRSDYQAFILNGIPSGGLFTGAEVPKTAEQQAIWGGTRAPSTTPATTPPATRSPTSTCTRSRSTPTP